MRQTSVSVGRVAGRPRSGERRIETSERSYAGRRGLGRLISIRLASDASVRKVFLRHRHGASLLSEAIKW